jgi:clan AA aspartic protease
MITGVVRSREARIELTIRGTGGREESIEAVIDTGFTGSLTLPAKLVKALELPWENVVRGTLADGSTCLLAIYQAAVVWDRRERPVFVVESESNALVGMELLTGFELKIQVRPTGKVSIKRLGNDAK